MSEVDGSNVDQLIERFRELGPYSFYDELLGLEEKSETKAQFFNEMLKKFYWIEKSSHSLVKIGRMGIYFCMSQASQYSRTDADRAKSMKSHAKTIAYNLAANSWPGWRDEGVLISQADRAEGLEAARFNLRLAQELEKPRDKLAMAYWLLGAQELANGEKKSALESFEKSANIYADLAKNYEANLSLGFFHVTNLSMGDKNSAGLIEAICGELKKAEGEIGSFYAKQIEDAQFLFVD